MKLPIAHAVLLALAGAPCLARDVDEATDWLRMVADKADTRHHESFSCGAAGNRWGGAITRWTPSGRPYVGSERSGETLTFRTDVPGSTEAILVRLKLFIIYHWDGNWSVYGPDVFRVQLDGHRELLRASFSNYRVVGQSYPDAWPWGENPARAGAAETGTLGWKFPGGWGEPLDAVYDVWLGAVRRGSGPMEIEFRGDFHDARDPHHLRGEQWGIESLEIHTFARSVDLPDDTWEILARQLFSHDPGQVATARALLPLAPLDRITRALDTAAAAYGLDRATLGKAAPQQHDAIADALENAAHSLRDRHIAPDAPPVPSVASRAERLHQTLVLMETQHDWRRALWNEMHRQHR